MRVILLSRQFNRAGLEVLKALASAPGCDLAAILLPPFGRKEAARRRLDRAWSAPWERLAYRIGCRYQGAQPLRFEVSTKRRARALGVPVELVASFDEASARDRIRACEPDLIVIGGGWPRLVPPDVIAAARFGAINVHPSLLPAFRGTDVHRWQIAAGARRSGVTVHRVDDHFDSGAILAQESFEVGLRDSPQVLADRGAAVSGRLVAGIIEHWTPDASAGPRLSTQPGPETALHGRWPWADSDFLAIDPAKPAAEVERFVRAATQESFTYDGPWIDVGGAAFIVRAASPHAARTNVNARRGELASIDGWPVLQCGGGALRLDRVQPRRPHPNRTRSMSGPAFARRVLRAQTFVCAHASSRVD